MFTFEKKEKHPCQVLVKIDILLFREGESLLGGLFPFMVISISTPLGLLKCFLSFFARILLYVIPCNSETLSHLTMNNQLRTGTDKGNLTV